MGEDFLSNFVSIRMKSRGWSLRRAAYQLKISPSYLSLILNHNVIPKPAVIEKIARGFDVSYSYLFIKTGLFKDGPFNSQVRTTLMQVCNDISFVVDVLTQFTKYLQLNIDRKFIDAFMDDFLPNEPQDVRDFFENIGDDKYEWVKKLVLGMHYGDISPQTGGKILVNIEEFIKHEYRSLLGGDLLYYLFDCIPAPFFNKPYAPLFAELLSMYSEAFVSTIKQFKKSKTNMDNFRFPEEFQYFFILISDERSEITEDEEEVLDTNLNTDDNNVSDISEINISTSISGDKASITITVPRDAVDTLLAKILNLVK